ncbi:hypothetical protein CB0940_05410 [Cercospora beticola]|uniref:Zinc-binding loop region of homing endonuclease domain-containing protein n=1 Tax=Cercospora beticola TaxID=122368 RepID=A0A2G5HYJ8_CERBT|nr:hypothetical protein CB0940_05410 [Cercospora beticola]PIA97608.1 hypothetical protein CB0940_05410 [Cercospora beticola]WPA97953.1 hypothetical protein RHO25_002564 [Cercospora beticola]
MSLGNCWCQSQQTWMSQTNPIVDGRVPGRDGYETCPIGPEHQREWALPVKRAEEYRFQHHDVKASWECKVALLQDDGFRYMCGLRAYEIVRKLGDSGPFQPEEAEEWFKEVGCLDGHVPSPEVDIAYEVRNLSYDGIEGIAIVLPPGYKCPRHGCDSYHSVFKVKFILQVRLRRFTASDWTKYTNKPDLEYSHLDSQTHCMNPVHAIYERGVVNVARQRCTTTGKKKYDHAIEVLLMWSEVMMHITLYFFFEEEIGECGAGVNSKLLARERKKHNFLEVPMNFHPMTLDCNTLFPHTDGSYQYMEQILLEREVITDVGSMINTMHFTDPKTSCNFMGQVKKSFNKAIVKRSEAMMESRSAVSEAEEETFM